MTDLVFNSSAEATLALTALGLNRDESISLENSSFTTESRYVVSASKTNSLVKDEGIYTISPAVIKGIRAGDNIILSEENSCIKITSTSGSSAIDSLGDLSAILPNNYKLADILGVAKGYTKTNTIIKKISDIQSLITETNINKANKATVDALKNDITKLLMSDVFYRQAKLIGDLTPFTEEYSLVDLISTKASKISVEQSMEMITELNSIKLDRLAFIEFRNKIGAKLPYTEDTPLISHLGDLSVFNGVTTNLMKSIGDITKLKKNIVDTIEITNKLGNLYESIPEDKTLNDVLGIMPPHITSINDSLSYLYDHAKEIDAIKAENTDKIANLEYNVTDIIDAVGKINTASDDYSIYSPLFSDEPLYESFMKCKKFIDDKKEEISDILNNIEIDSEAAELITIRDSLEVGVVYNEDYNLEMHFKDQIYNMYSEVHNINGLNYYMFKDKDNTILWDYRHPIYLCKNSTYNIYQNHISNDGSPIGFSLNINGPYNKINTVIKVKSNGIGPFTKSVYLDNMSIYSNTEYILDSSSYIQTNLINGFIVDKLALYYDSDLTMKYPVIEETSDYIKVQVKDDEKLYYGVVISGTKYSNKIDVKSFIYTPEEIKYFINDIEYTYDQYAKLFDINANCRIVLSNIKANSIFYFKLREDGDSIDTNNAKIKFVDTPDISLKDKVELKNKILVNNIKDGIHFIPYLTHLNPTKTTVYHSKEAKYTNAEGYIKRFNLDVHYNHVRFDVCTRLHVLDEKIQKINLEMDHPILFLEDIKNIHLETNRSLADIIGSGLSELLTNNGTITEYLNKLGTQRELNDLFSDRTLIDFIGDIKTLKNFQSITYFIEKIGNINVPNDINLASVIGDLSNWNQEKLTLNDSFNHIESLNLFVGDLSQWDVDSSYTLIKLLNTFGTVNIKEDVSVANVLGNLHKWNIGDVTLSDLIHYHNTLTNIVGDISMYSSDNNTLVASMNKIGDVVVGHNVLKDIFGDLKSWSIGNTETLSSLLSKIGKLNISNNKLSDIIGYINSVDDIDTISSVLTKLGKLKNTVPLSIIVGEEIWNTSNDTVINCFNKLGNIKTLNGVVFSDVLGDISDWKTDTISTVLKKIGILKMTDQNDVSKILGDLTQWNINDNNTYMHLLQQLGKFDFHNNTLSSILGNIDSIDLKLSYCVDELLNRFGKFTAEASTNTVTNVLGEIEHWNKENTDNIVECVSKIGILSVGSTYKLTNVLGDLSYWNLNYSTVANIIQSVGQLRLKQGSTLSNILGNFDNIDFYDTIADVISKVGSSITISRFLPPNKLTLIDVIGDCSKSFTNDTISDRLRYLGTYDQLTSSMSNDMTIIEVLGDLKKYSKEDTVSKRLQYMLGDNIDLIHSSLPKIGQTEIIDRPLMSLIGNFDKDDYGYIQSNKNMVESIHLLEKSFVEITNVYEKYNAALSSIGSFTDGSINLSDTINELKKSIDKISKVSLKEPFAMDGYYPLYFSKDNALKDFNTTHVVELPSTTYGSPFNIQDIKFYMPISPNVNLYIPTMNNAYYPPNTIPNTQTFEELLNKLGNIYTDADNVHNRLNIIESGSIPSVLWKNSFNDLKDLDTLIEDESMEGWCYYIKENGNLYVILDGVYKDYRPSNWRSKSFMIISNYTKVTSLIDVTNNKIAEVEHTVNNVILPEMAEVHLINKLKPLLKDIEHFDTNLNMDILIDIIKKIGILNIDHMNTLSSIIGNMKEYKSDTILDRLNNHETILNAPKDNTLFNDIIYYVYMDNNNKLVSSNTNVVSYMSNVYNNKWFKDFQILISDIDLSEYSASGISFTFYLTDISDVTINNLLTIVSYTPDTVYFTEFFVSYSNFNIVKSSYNITNDVYETHQSYNYSIRSLGSANDVVFFSINISDEFIQMYYVTKNKLNKTSKWNHNLYDVFSKNNCVILGAKPSIKNIKFANSFKQSDYVNSRQTNYNMSDFIMFDRILTPSEIKYISAINFIITYIYKDGRS